MSEHETRLLAFQPEQSDRDKLNQTVRELQTLVHNKNTEISELRLQFPRPNEETSRVGREQQQLTLFSGIQDGEARENQFRSFNSPKWIRAQKDYPDDTSCFGRRYPTILVYDTEKETFSLSRVDELPDEHAIVSRLPSRWRSAIHVYNEIVSRGSTFRVKVTTKDRVPFGMVYYCSIYPRKISNIIRLRILFGDIRWVFIKIP